jgi:hypothetical protein
LLKGLSLREEEKGINGCGIFTTNRSLTFSESVNKKLFKNTGGVLNGK